MVLNSFKYHKETKKEGTQEVNMVVMIWNIGLQSWHYPNLELISRNWLKKGMLCLKMDVFDYKNLNGYKSNNPKLLPKMKMQVENLYPIREKII